MSDPVWKVGDLALVRVAEISAPGAYPAVRLECPDSRIQWCCATALHKPPEPPKDVG